MMYRPANYFKQAVCMMYLSIILCSSRKHKPVNCQYIFIDAYPNDEIVYEWKSEDAVVVGESSIASQYHLEDTITSTKDVYFKSSSE
jgi:hypothetical protein